MAVDWQADLEKKVRNLVRAFVAEVEAHGDGDLLMDEPMVILHNGMVDIHVFTPPSKSPPASQGETFADEVGKTSSKKKGK